MFDVKQYSALKKAKDMKFETNTDYSGILNKARETRYSNYKEPRSLSDRFFDSMGGTQFVTMGILRGIINDDRTVLDGIWDGIKAANPLGEGFEQGEHSFSDVIGDVGFNPTTATGRFMKGAVGLAGDILFDPSTYLTGGLAGVVKGTGAVNDAMKVADAVRTVSTKYDVIAKNGAELASSVYKKTFDDLISKGKVTTTQAEHLAKLKTAKVESELTNKIDSLTKGLDINDAIDSVKRSSTKAGKVLSDSEVLEKATEFKTNFDKLIGINRKTKDLTLSLGNAPLGKKIFGELADKSIKLADAETVGKIGDAGIGKVYNKLRSDIYKSELGNMFSKNATLYKLALKSPDALYDSLEMITMKLGYTKEFNKAKRLIYRELERFELTPDEKKEILNILQDPSQFRTIKDKIKFVQTIEGKNLQKSYMNDFDKLRDEINYFSTIKKQKEDLIDVGKSKIDELKQNIFEADIERVQKLRSLNDAFDEIKMPDPVKSAKTTASKTDDILHVDRVEDVDGLKSIKKIFKSDAVTTKAKIEKVNEFLADSGIKISNSVRDKDVYSLMNVIKNAVNKDEVIDFIKKNENLYNDKMKTVYQHIAKVIGYGDEYGFKSWADYTKYIEDLNTKRKVLVDEFGVEKAERLIQADMKKSLTALTERANKNKKGFAKTTKAVDPQKVIDDYLIKKDTREKMLREFNNLSMKETMEKITKFNNDEMMRDYYRLIDEGSLNSTSKNYKDFKTRRQIVDEIATRDPQELNKDLGRATKPEQQMRYKSYVINKFDKAKMKSSYIENKIFKNQKVKDKTKLNKDGIGEIKVSEAVEKWVDKVIDEAQEIYDDIFKYDITTYDASLDRNVTKSYVRQFNELSDKQIEYLFDVSARRIADKALATEKKILDDGIKLPKEVAKAQKVKLLKDEILKLGDEVDNELKLESSSAVAKNSIRDIDIEFELAKDAQKAQLSKHQDDIRKVEQYYDDYKANLMNDLVKYENGLISLKKDLDKFDVKTYESKLDELGKLQKILSSDEAFEQFMINSHGTKFVNDVIDAQSPVHTLLDDRLKIEDKVALVSTKLKNRFNEIGASEVNIGKLSEEQFENFIDMYVPHVLTDDGRKFFTKNQENKVIAGFGKEFGFGKKFSPYQKSRSIKALTIDGEFVKNPTIDQLNTYFKEKFPDLIEGKNVFVDDIADLYIARAIKNKELLYDNAFMNDMSKTFGLEFDPLKKVPTGFKTVINISHLKKGIWSDAYAIAKENIAKGTSQTTDLKLEAESQIAELLGMYGLDAKVLDDLSMPFIELNKSQASLLSGSKLKPNVFNMSEEIVDKTNLSRKNQILKDNNKLLDMFDKFTHFIKLNQTTVMPGFHVRNKFSNTFNSWLGVGSKVFDVDLQKQTFNAIIKKGKVDDVVSIPTKNGGFKDMSMEELYNVAKDYGVIDEGFFEKELGTSSGSKGLFKGLPKGADPTDTRSFKPYEIGAKAGSIVESQDRFLHFVAQLQNGKGYREASESVNTFLFDYGDLTGFEQNVMKRIFPYYTWMRKNAPLQLQMMLEHPEKYRNTNKILHFPEKMLNEDEKVEDRDLADFAKDWIQTPFTQQRADKVIIDKNGVERTVPGGVEPVMWNPGMPFQDVNKVPNIFDMKDTAKQYFSMLNPILKVPVEQALNRNVFFDEAIVDDEGNGRINHILSQLSMYNTATGIKDKEGVDKALQILNALSGVKFYSNDIEGVRLRKLIRAQEEKND